VIKFHSLKVLETAPDASDAVAIALDAPPELRGEYSGHAGQHVVIRATLEGQEVRRTYSLVNAPGEWPLRIVPRVHAQGLMSRFLAEQLRVGDLIEVLPPNGSFSPRAGGAGGLYVAFAAGCGITPVLSVIRALLARKDTQVILFYGNTGTARAMCLEDVLALKDRHLGRLALHFVMSREPQESELYNGRLDGARLRHFAGTFFEPLAVREYFVCGPGDMIEQVTQALRQLGVDPGRVHAEHFTLATTADRSIAQPTADVTPLQVPTAAQAQDVCEVSVLMDGRRRTFTMDIGNETVLDAAARAGIELPFSCRAGVCSTCRTKVVGGKVSMAQNYALEDWEIEQGYVLACQSRPQSATLELDYDEK
jgi:ring-1,2-phenylacetyl-CoA epoxidase subunit PaaE